MNKMGSDVKQKLKTMTIRKIDEASVCIEGFDFSFFYTDADSVVKDDLKGVYKYFGGLHCIFVKDSIGYDELEKELVRICKAVLNIQK